MRSRRSSPSAAASVTRWQVVASSKREPPAWRIGSRPNRGEDLAAAGSIGTEPYCLVDPRSASPTIDGLILRRHLEGQVGLLGEFWPASGWHARGTESETSGRGQAAKGGMRWRLGWALSCIPADLTSGFVRRWDVWARTQIGQVVGDHIWLLARRPCCVSSASWPGTTRRQQATAAAEQP